MIQKGLKYTEVAKVLVCKLVLQLTDFLWHVSFSSIAFQDTFSYLPE